MQRLKPQPGKGTQRLGRPKESGKTGTQRSGGGTTPVEKQAKKLLAIATGSKGKDSVFRTKKDGAAAPRLLARIEQLRLLSRLEELKILSLLQSNGITLTFIEKSGLIQAAENLGLLSKISDRNTPGLLFKVAFALYTVAPAAVYFIPDDSAPLIVAQVLVVAVGALGGTAAYAGGSLLSALQKEF